MLLFLDFKNIFFIFFYIFFFIFSAFIKSVLNFFWPGPDLTIMMERRSRQLSLRANILSEEDSCEFLMLASALRESAACLLRHMRPLQGLGGFLRMRAPPLVLEGGAEEGDWAATAQRMRALIQQRQAQQLALLCDSMLSKQDAAAYRRAVLAAYSREMYGGPSRRASTDAAPVSKVGSDQTPTTRHQGSATTWRTNGSIST